MPALVIVWSLHEPARIGEVLLVPGDGRARMVGRGRQPDSRYLRLECQRQRPGQLESTGPLQAPTLSREQLLLETFADRIQVRNVGRCPLRVNGVALTQAELKAGDLLELREQLLLLCVLRPPTMATRPGLLLHPFGQVDRLGIVGESPAAWELRAQLVFMASSNAHVLIRGESGTGKELVARALHMLSPRAEQAMVARNAATFPESLIDAELFGNVKNYPNPGMPDRPGLVGEAHGSDLFLDEFGELPTEMQAHLLRVLDLGEYQRLGETQTRRANLRLLAATNRPESHLKHDLLARLKLRLEVPDLNARREDIPLIARFLLRGIGRESPPRAEQFFEGGVSGEPRMAPELMATLVRRTYTTHVRELERLLWQSIAISAGDFLELPESLMVEGTGASVADGGAGIAEAPTAPLTEASTPTPPPLTPSPTPSVPPLSSGEAGRSAQIEAWEATLEPQDRVLLTVFRRHRFRITDSTRDPECPVERATADLYLRVLLLKGLRHEGWSLRRGAQLIAGPDNPWLEPRVLERLETLIQNLRERLDEDPAAVRQKLSRYYRSAYPVVEETLLALRSGRVHA